MEQDQAEASVPKGTFIVLWVWTATAAALIALVLERQAFADPLRVYPIALFPVVVAVVWSYLRQVAIVRAAIACFIGAEIGLAVGVWPLFTIGFIAPNAPSLLGMVIPLAYGLCVGYAAFAVWRGSAFSSGQRVAVLIAGLGCLAVSLWPAISAISPNGREVDPIAGMMAAGFALLAAGTFVAATRILKNYRAA